MLNTMAGWVIWALTGRKAEAAGSYAAMQAYYTRK